jgi:hypothetical protein
VILVATPFQSNDNVVLHEGLEEGFRISWRDLESVVSCAICTSLPGDTYSGHGCIIPIECGKVSKGNSSGFKMWVYVFTVKVLHTFETWVENVVPIVRHITPSLRQNCYGRG